jgi:hypothetical protein
MTPFRIASRHIRLLVVAAVVAFAGGRARADSVALFSKLMADRGPAIVTLKFVLKVKSSAGEDEREREISGVMIDPKGLVVCSGTQTGGFSEAMKRQLARGGSFTVTPTEMKVLVGDDSEGVDAKIIARDTDLDLAWVQIEKPADKPYACVDPARGVAARPGQRAFVVRRMDKFFDRAAVISEGWIAGVVKKPRELYVPGGTISTAGGLPAFGESGEMLGVVIVQMSDEEDSRGSGGASGAFILPCAELVKATQRARESAATGKSEPENHHEGAHEDKTDPKDQDD